MANAFNDMTKCIREMLQARGQLLLDVSHELRSPLTRLKVALEFLPNSEVKENIREDVDEMEMMVREILETARLADKHGRLDIQPVNVAELICKTAAGFENRPLCICLDSIPDEIIIDADANLARTVLKNILNNALKYSGPSNKPVTIHVDRKNEFVVIRIRDNGIGIPKEDLPYIFEPFYRVDKSRSKDTGGYGLGLSLCKTIMEAHGGKIEIESAPASGTRVSLFFPAGRANGPAFQHSDRA
jgi:signal transduction histidine kinase